MGNSGSLREKVTIVAGKIWLANTKEAGQRLPLTHGMSNLGMYISVQKKRKRDWGGERDIFKFNEISFCMNFDRLNEFWNMKQNNIKLIWWRTYSLFVLFSTPEKWSWLRMYVSIRSAWWCPPPHQIKDFRHHRICKIMWDLSEIQTLFLLCWWVHIQILDTRLVK